MTQPCAEDTCSLSLGITEDGKLAGDVNLDPDGGLLCAPGRGLGFRLNPSVCNGLTIDAQGLRYNEHDHRVLLAPGAAPAPGIVGVSPGIVGINVNIDAFYAAYQGTGGAPPGATPQIETTTRTTGSLTNTTCREMVCSARYTVIPGFDLGNGWDVAIGCYQNRNWPAGGFSEETPFVQYDHSGNPFGNNRWLAGGYQPRVYDLVGIILQPGQTLTAQAAASLSVRGPGQTIAIGNRAEWRFGVGLLLTGQTRA